jgi:hypothetical protein
MMVVMMGGTVGMVMGGSMIRVMMMGGMMEGTAGMKSSGAWHGSGMVTLWAQCSSRGQWCYQ